MPARATAAPVVIGYDGSRDSLLALDAAAVAAEVRSAPIVVLTLTAPVASRSHSLRTLHLEAESAHRRAGEASAEALHYLHSRHPGLAADAVVASDAAASAVVRLSRDAQLLVLGHRGAKGRRSLTMGSFSNDLATVFGCPLLLTPDDYRPPPATVRAHDHALVLAGVDGREDSEAVLTAAAEEAARRDLTLVAVHSCAGPGGLADPPVQRTWSAFRAAVEGAGLAGGPGHRLVVTLDEPVGALLSRLRAHDLLVVGTRAEGRLAGLVAGSVSRAVLDAVPCPTLVERPAPRQVQLDIQLDAEVVGEGARHEGREVVLADPGH